jgi:hypothetical protein
MCDQKKEHPMFRDDNGKNPNQNSALNRRDMLLGGTTLAATAAVATSSPVRLAQAQQQPAPSEHKPNILVIFGDDIGQSDISAYTFGLMSISIPTATSCARRG